MTDFMILIRENELAQQRMALTQVQELLERRGAFVETLRQNGAYRDAGRLRPSSEGRRVRPGGVEPGPFEEATAFSAYLIVQAESLEAAVEIAAGVPLSPGDVLDVRPLMGGHLRPGKEEARGKVFAFGVLGNAKSEAEWVSLMDRIERDTSNGFDDRFLGGARLEAPGRGRHVELRGEQRSVVDGPFLECKEVIGGIFFMRLADLDEAIAFAAASKFMPHGALEVRELWRS